MTINTVDLCTLGLVMPHSPFVISPPDSGGAGTSRAIKTRAIKTREAEDRTSSGGALVFRGSLDPGGDFAIHRLVRRYSDYRCLTVNGMRTAG